MFLQLLLHFSRNMDETFQLLLPWPEDDHILSRSCSTDFYQSHGPLAIFNSKSCLCNSSSSFQWILMKPSNYSLQLLLQFSVDFNKTFQLLLPWPEEDHINSRVRLTAVYQRHAPLSVWAILSTEVLVFITPSTVQHCLEHICYRHITTYWHFKRRETLGLRPCISLNFDSTTEGWVWRGCPVSYVTGTFNWFDIGLQLVKACYSCSR